MKTEVVTNLKRQATRILAEMRDSGESVLITEHGTPSAYLVDVESFEFTQRKLRVLEGIVRGERGDNPVHHAIRAPLETRLAPAISYSSWRRRMNSRKSGTVERKTFHAPDAAAWSAWLDSHAGTAREVWLEFPKKHTSRPCVTYENALDEALCRGWIDSVIKKVNDDVYLRKFTPRTNTTNWSAKNLAAIKRLIADRRMRPEGLAVLGVALDTEASPATASPSASDSSENGEEIPPFVEEAIAANPKARVFWESLAPGYRKRYLGWIMSAKQQTTRESRLSRVVGFLEEGKKSMMV